MVLLTELLPQHPHGPPGPERIELAGEVGALGAGIRDRRCAGAAHEAFPEFLPLQRRLGLAADQRLVVQLELASEPVEDPAMTFPERHDPGPEPRPREPAYTARRERSRRSSSTSLVLASSSAPVMDVVAPSKCPAPTLRMTTWSWRGKGYRRCGRYTR